MHSRILIMKLIYIHYIVAVPDSMVAGVLNVYDVTMRPARAGYQSNPQTYRRLLFEMLAKHNVSSR